MIYIHGGEGHASVSSVVEAMNRGFACISLDTEGTTNTTGPNNFSEGGSSFANDRAGHISNDCFESGEKPLEEQWMYWAVGDTILANTVSVTVPENAYMYFITFEGHNEEVAQMRKKSPYREYCDYADDAVYSSTNIVLLLGDTIQYIYKK